MIAKITIDNIVTYLDATERQLEFGRLPAKIYNGQAREITATNAVSQFFVADSLKEVSSTIAYISNMENGTVEGSLTHNYGIYESQRIRNKMAKSALDDFKKSVQQDYSEEIVISNIQLDSLKLLKEPVALRYDLTIKSFADEDIIYFNPMLSEIIKSNPFKASERFYPVEMPFTFDDIYTLTMEVPKGYTVDELPKSVRLNFNEDEGMFEYIISADKEYVQMRSRLVLKKANYVNDDYQPLRHFYAFVVKKEAEQIVFKKIK